MSAVSHARRNWRLSERRSHVLSRITNEWQSTRYIANGARETVSFVDRVLSNSEEVESKLWDGANTTLPTRFWRRKQ